MHCACALRPTRAASCFDVLTGVYKKRPCSAGPFLLNSFNTTVVCDGMMYKQISRVFVLVISHWPGRTGLKQSCSSCKKYRGVVCASLRLLCSNRSGS